jgi:Uma2 family endonuclease
MKVKIAVAQNTSDFFYYPDVMVTCDPQDTEKYYKTYPCLIVEVLSPSTQELDRREKRLNYQSLESLQEYVLVSQTEKKVEVYRRLETGKWSVESLVKDDSLELKSVGLTLTIADIYDEVLT